MQDLTSHPLAPFIGAADLGQPNALQLIAAMLPGIDATEFPDPLDYKVFEKTIEEVARSADMATLAVTADLHISLDPEAITALFEAYFNTLGQKAPKGLVDQMLPGVP